MASRGGKKQLTAKQKELHRDDQIFQEAFMAECRHLGEVPDREVLEEVEGKAAEGKPVRKIVLDAKGPQCASAALAALSGYRHCYNVHIWRSNVGDAGLNKVAQLFKFASRAMHGGASRLRMADISADTIPTTRTEGVLPEAPAFSPQCLRSFCLEGTKKAQETLRHLAFERDGLGDSEAVAIAKGLAGNATLASLRLGGNRIGPEGARAITELIRETTFPDEDDMVHPLDDSTRLQELRLGDNPLGDQGAKEIMEAAQMNSFLRALDISWIGMKGDEGSIGACEATMRSHRAMWYLDLGHNLIDDRYIRRIIEAMRSNETIRVVLATHYASRDAVFQLNSLLKARRKKKRKAKPA